LQAGILDEAVQVMEDEDGWGVVGMAIQGSCGHREREAVVRAVVGRWGLEAGPRQGRDNGVSFLCLRGLSSCVADWTPLHLAAIISTPPLISFLLTRGASTSAVTDRGLTPFDLVAGMPNREEISLLLENPEADGHTESPKNEEADMNTDRHESLRKHRARATYKMVRDKDKERKLRREEEREQWIREQSGITSVEAELLLPPKRHHGRRSVDSGLAWVTSDDEDEESASEDEEDLSNSVSQPFRPFWGRANEYSRCMVHSMICSSSPPGTSPPYWTSWSPATGPMLNRQNVEAYQQTPYIDMPGSH
jgi:ankyrin repeat protein